jgi:integrase
MAQERSQEDVRSLGIGKHNFGSGLYLQVRGQNARSWLLRRMLHGKERWVGVGSAKDLTLAKAQQKCAQIRQQFAEGIDPVAEKRRRRLQRDAKHKQSFRLCVDEFIRAQDDGEWSNAKHRQQWRNTLETYAYPTIGDVPGDEVTAAQVVDILRPLWIEKHETARRLRGRIEAVLDYSADPDNPSWRNPAALTAQFRKKLPKLSTRSRAPKHHPAMPFAAIPEFMQKLRSCGGDAARALEFIVLTAARVSEALRAEWPEMDEAGRKWSVPQGRMKMRRYHDVPLSDPAIRLLSHMPRSGPYVFPGQKVGRPLSGKTPNLVLRRLGWGHDDGVTHGMRSTLRDWCSHIGCPPEVAKRALAHVVGDKTERAYARSDLFENRVALMDLWGRYCAGEFQGHQLRGLWARHCEGTIEGDNVVPIRTAQRLPA